jgi:serine/threonine protein kinase
MDAKHSHREILNHQQLLHPHVVQLRDVLCVPPYLALVMEYVPGGDMFQYVVSRRGLPEAEARWFFQQLVLGMDYCHRKGEDRGGEQEGVRRHCFCQHPKLPFRWPALSPAQVS